MVRFFKVPRRILLQCMSLKRGSFMLIENVSVITDFSNFVLYSQNHELNDNSKYQLPCLILGA